MSTLISSQNLCESFGQRLRVVRKTKGLSQETLASIAGLDRTYIGGVERGERNPSLVNLGRIANALGMSIADLFEGL